MKYNKHTEYHLYYTHHISSKIGAIVTTVMLSALLLLFLVGRSTLDYSALKIPEREERVRVVSMKIHNIVEERVKGIVQDVPVQKKRVFRSPARSHIKKKFTTQHTSAVTPHTDSSHDIHVQESQAGVIEQKEERPAERVASAPRVEENTPTDVEKAISAILQTIESKKTYPRVARRAGYEGTVQVQVELNTQGVITGYALYQSSGYAILDNAILDVVKKMYGTKVTDILLNAPMKAIIPIRYALQ